MKEHRSFNKFKLFSKDRLQYKPKGESLRKKIKEELSKFSTDDYNHLSASLITNKKEYFDIENALFYNIGCGFFTKFDLDEVSFSLDYSVGNQEEYTYLYELLSETAQPVKGESVLDFSFEIDKMATFKKPLDYWLAFKQGNTDINKLNVNNLEKFHIYLVIETPLKYKNLISLIKPLLDGIISAFHYQSNLDKNVIGYIERKKSISIDVIKSYFCKEEYTFLGEKNLITPFRNGIKWNPSDEKCTSVNIKMKKGINPYTKIYGSVYI